jgi:FKBP-type peptidyl-prolyl cis-trans isomerase 2
MAKESLITKGCMVKINYVMKTCFLDGTVKELSPDTLEFIFGVERQAPALEAALEAARVGDRFSVHIPAEEIYGAYDPDLIREIPKEGLIKQRIKEGQFYRQIKSGHLISFKVLEVKENTLLADFNKPTAGISVTMDLEVLGIRKAGKKETDMAREAQRRKEIGCA